MEMLPPLLADRQLGEKRVREEGLAAADTAPEIDAAQRRARSRQQCEAARKERIAGQDPPAQVFEARERRALGRVERMALGRECSFDARRERRSPGVRAQLESSGRLRK